MSFYWIMLALAICTGLVGQILLKAGASGSNFLVQLLDIRTMSGFVLYGGAALLYIVALRRIPMSVAMPCTAASYIAAALVGHYMFGEALSAMRLAGIGMICGGVVVLAFS